MWLNETESVVECKKRSNNSNTVLKDDLDALMLLHVSVELN